MYMIFKHMKYLYPIPYNLASMKFVSSIYFGFLPELSCYFLPLDLISNGLRFFYVGLTSFVKTVRFSSFIYLRGHNTRFSISQKSWTVFLTVAAFTAFALVLRTNSKKFELLQLFFCAPVE